MKVTAFDVVQVLHNGEWLDYATIRSEDDLKAARRTCQGGEFRVRSFSRNGRTCAVEDSEWIDPPDHY